MRKPVVEKMRRDRINSSIEQLRTLLAPEFLNQQPDSKLEKADILEMTVSFLRRRQKQPNVLSTSSTAVSEGFSRCVHEVLHFLSKDEVKTQSQRKLLNHLQNLQPSTDRNWRESDLPLLSSTHQQTISKEESSVQSALWRPCTVPATPLQRCSNGVCVVRAYIADAPGAACWPDQRGAFWGLEFRAVVPPERRRCCRPLLAAGGTARTLTLRKPVVEKMRRDHINSSIEQLRTLLAPEFLNQNSLQAGESRHPGDDRQLPETTAEAAAYEVKTQSQRKLLNHVQNLQPSTDRKWRESDLPLLSSTDQQTLSKEESSVQSALWRP
ncbi:hypothetical protein NFI96_006506, partial [Prochilodus magdalenae]